MIGAVDIGGTKLAVGLVAESGKVLAKSETLTGADSNYSAGLENIARVLREMAQNARVEITGIGIGSTGPVNPLTGEFGEVDFLPHWRRQNPVQYLAKLFGVKVALENDADAGALAEAELGHQVIDPAGPPCSCGFRGCWESLAAGPAMAIWTRNQVSANDSHRTAEQICQLAREGDELARRAVEREAYYLGLGLANLINLFAPDMIVLGGSIMKSALLFLEGIRKTIGRGCRFVPHEKTELALASLGEDANLIGAARVWHHRYGEEG